MNLTDIKVENFRGISSLHLPLDRLTVLIGENNTGKSTVLEAIRRRKQPTRFQSPCILPRNRKTNGPTRLSSK